MKKFLVAFLLIGLNAFQPLAYAGKTPNTEEVKKMRSRIHAYITYPRSLLKKHRGGETVIQFRLDAQHRIIQLVSRSQNPELNEEVVQDLKGKKLVGIHSERGTTYTFRLLFKP